jgi:hypothetical protein
MKVTGSNPDDEGISEAEAKKMLREVFFHDDYIN